MLGVRGGAVCRRSSGEKQCPSLEMARGTWRNRRKTAAAPEVEQIVKRRTNLCRHFCAERACPKMTYITWERQRAKSKTKVELKGAPLPEAPVPERSVRRTCQAGKPPNYAGDNR